MKRAVVRTRIVAFAIVAMLSVAADAAVSSAANDEVCARCVTIRIGRPIVLRGPSRDSDDAPFSFITLTDGRFRGFTANGTTYAIDASSSLGMNEGRRAVLKPDAKGTPGDCGRWITSVIADGDKLYGFIHNEQSCDYSKGQTHKSMSIGVSADQGLSWTDLGPIISSGQPVEATKSNGEGDCRGVDGNDDYLYAYCLRPTDWKNTVARAKKSDPRPGQWFKWDGSGWNVAALGGTGAPLANSPGVSAAFWIPQNLVVLLNTDRGIRLSLSRDKIHFDAMSAPLIVADADQWKRPAPSELYAYPSINGMAGGNQFGNKFYLSYTYLPAGEDFKHRFLVMHEATMSLADQPASPQVRVMLSRYKNSEGARWATTGPTIENDSSKAYPFERTLGEVMTSPPPEDSVKLDECVRKGEAGFDYLLSASGCRENGYQRRRTAGWIYRDQRPGTAALFRCGSPEKATFVSRDEQCEGQGSEGQRLGYAFID